MSTRPKYQNNIEDRINGFDYGTVFSASDFIDIAPMSAANEALHRMNEDAVISRVMKGIYYKPEYSEWLGEYVAPNMEKVAKALARKFNWTIAPAGNTALNMLSLSTQVPATWAYVSDGPYRKYEIGRSRLEFKHVKSGDVAGKHEITIAVIQAISTIGRKAINQSNVKTLKRVLSDDDKRIILEEAQTTTSWIYEVIRKVCAEDQNA